MPLNAVLSVWTDEDGLAFAVQHFFLSQIKEVTQSQRFISHNVVCI